MVVVVQLFNQFISCYIITCLRRKCSICGTATQQIPLFSDHLATPSKILLSFISSKMMGPKYSQEKTCKIQFLKSGAILRLSKESR